MTRAQQEEKLMKVFWLRPAFHKHYYSKFINKRSLINTTTYLFFFFFFLFSLLFLSPWTHIGKKFYGKNSVQIISNQKPVKRALEFPVDCTAWNKSNTCPKNYPKHAGSGRSGSSSCPEYFRWIHEDLKHWKTSGITQEMVERAKTTAHLRIVILDGRLYVEKYRPSIQTRALYTMWGIVQLMRLYPGQLPDLELMFDCDDRPVVPAKEVAPPPVFRYCSDWQSLDIVFPDWSFWGWAETNIRPWKSVLKDIQEGNVFWSYFVTDWIAESQKGYKQSNLGDQCTHRYKIYIEGWAWSVSEKYILACNSPTLYVTPRWYDFFIRGMIPQQHYWPIRGDNKCNSLKFAVEWGNNHIEKAKAIGEAGSRFIHEDLKMENVYNYIFHLLNEYAKLLKYKPSIPPNATELCSESLVCNTEGIWRKFMEESLEMSPSDSVPCSMPPPYKTHEFKTFVDEKHKATQEVEAWETKYLDKENKG